MGQAGLPGAVATAVAEPLSVVLLDFLGLSPEPGKEPRVPLSGDFGGFGHLYPTG